MANQLKKTFTKTQLKSAAKAYRTGSSKDAAAVLGVSAPTAIKLLRANGVAIRPRGGGNRAKRSTE